MSAKWHADTFLKRDQTVAAQREKKVISQMYA